MDGTVLAALNLGACGGSMSFAICLPRDCVGMDHSSVTKYQLRNNREYHQQRWGSELFSLLDLELWIRDYA
jgi:hypothetical protein